jgi:hypothetical protein
MFTWRGRGGGIFGEKQLDFVAKLSQSWIMSQSKLIIQSSKFLSWSTLFCLKFFCAVRSYFNRVLSSFRDLALIYKPTWYWLMIILQSIAVLLLIGYPDCGWVSLSASFSVWLISSDLMSPWFCREWRGRRKIESGWIHRGDQEEEEKKAGISECVCVCVESSNDIYHCNLSGTTALFFSSSTVFSGGIHLRICKDLSR